jgi:O-antigen/teichoic acid export membrane protein
VFPAIIQSREEAGTAYRDDLQKLFLVSVAVAYAIAVATIIVAPLVISILFGAGYESGAPLLRIHILSLVAVSLGLCSGSWIFAEGRIILSLYRTVIGAATNAALNWVLIPVAGTQGAAIATVASLFVAFYVFDFFVPSMRQVFIMKSRAIFLLGLVDYSRRLIARTRA